jgi:hypothetical protein
VHGTLAWAGGSLLRLARVPRPAIASGETFVALAFPDLARVGIGRGLTPVKILFRLRLQKFILVSTHKLKRCFFDYLFIYFYEKLRFIIFKMF